MKNILLGVGALVMGACSSDRTSPFTASGGASAFAVGGQAGTAPVQSPGGTGGVASNGAAGATQALPSGDPMPFTLGPVQSSTCSTQDVTILFVVDRSGSMNCNLPPTTASADCEAMSPPKKVDDTQPSKWDVISQALSESLAELGSIDGSVRVRAGMSFFSIDSVCGAASAPAVPVAATTPAQLDAIDRALAAAKPKGGTPIVGATILGYKHLYTTLGVNGNAHVILITDGKDSCAEYYAAQPSIGPGDQVAKLISTEAPQALGVGIKTWVIGAPGSEIARSTLSSLAVAGGTRRTPDCTVADANDPTVGNCHYDMTTGDFHTTLTTALKHILSVVTCQTIR